MKQTITVVGFDGKATTVEFKTRNLGILEGQLKNKSQIFTPKKGKGSYKRNKIKYEREEYGN